MQKELLSNLLRDLRSIDEVYHSAVYGAKHKEAILVKLLAEFGSKRAQKRLTHKNLIQAIQEVTAIEKVIENRAKIRPRVIEFNSEQMSLIRVVIRDELRIIKKIPALSKEQAIISFAAIFEGFISNVLKTIFDNKIDTLKSTKSSLNDEELIDAIKTGNPLDKLKEVKIRTLMYSSVDSWIRYFQDNFGFNVKIPNDIIELFLVRNCLIHNDKLISRDLEKKIKKRRYIYGKQINITEKDYNRYKNIIKNSAKKIWKEYIDKFQRTDA